MTLKWHHNTLVGLTCDNDQRHRHPTVEGLYFRIRGNRKSWLWARFRNGRTFKATLGNFPTFRIADAEVWATDLNRKFELGDDPLVQVTPVAPPVEEVRTTVAEAWKLYIADRIRVGKKAIYPLDLLGQKDIVPVCGAKPVRDVTTADIERIVSRPLERWKKSKIGCTGGTTRSNAILQATRTFFTWCAKREIDGLIRNPAAALDPVKERGHKPKRTLSVRELALLILAAREYDRRGAKPGCRPTRWADAISLIVLNGNRKSEVFCATKSEWDGVERVWRLPASRYKTDVDVEFRVGPTSAAIMDSLAGGNDPSPFLLPYGQGIRTGRDSHVCKALRAIMEEIGGEPVESWTLHAIRHGFRTHIRKSKIADSELAERLIHPKAKAAMSDHYDEWKEEEAVALSAWDGLIQAEIAKIVASRIKLTA